MRVVVLGLTFLLLPLVASGEETVVESVNLPGASLSQEVTYSTTRGDYNDVRDSVLDRMKKGDKSAFVSKHPIGTACRIAP
ncbi:hypothetical protein FHT71_006438 [Rhizobium sp. BK060]|nr:hypothetical protein [Rhizobium sp. BK060]